LAGVAGFVLSPGVCSFAFGVFYLQHTELSVLQNILRGVSAAAAGLLMATGLRLLAPHRDGPQAVLFASLAFADMTFSGLPLLAVLSGLASLQHCVAAASREPAQ
jgi:chromate transporter